MRRKSVQLPCSAHSSTNATGPCLRPFLSTLPFRREDELAVNLALRVESQAYLASAKNEVEQEVGNTLSVCHEIRRTIELVVAGLEIGLHFRPFCAAFATWPSGLSGRLGYVRLQRLTSCVYP